MKAITYILVLAVGFCIASCNTSSKAIDEVSSIKVEKPELVNLDNIKADVEALAADAMEGREVGTLGEIMAAEYLVERMKSIGLQPKGTKGYYQYFEKKRSLNPHGEVTAGSPVIKGRNVVGYLDNGARYTVVIGAHYDHLGYGKNGIGSLYAGKEPAVHNGADDNASGVAGMLHIAETLVQGAQTGYNYLFVGFSGEELGLWGSNQFAKNPTVDKEVIAYMLNMDMIGRLDGERRLLLSGTGTSPQWKSIIPKQKNHNFKIVEEASGIGPTDHTSFYLEGIPVLSFFTGQHADYHKPSDDAHLINYAGIKELTSFIMDIIGNTQRKGKLTFSKTKDSTNEKMDFKVTLGVMPDYLYDGEGMKMDGVKEDRPASNSGMIKGDVVVKMGDLKIANMQDYMKALSKFEPGQTTPVTILREGKAMVMEVTF